MDMHLVSIITLAYNHAPFIRQCIEGIMMQKTSFPFELFIHDDASTDATADIIREYQAQYPDIIKPIYQKENHWVQKKSILRQYIYPNVKGKYIALCEGDDYWTDPNKLQRQIDFLETHPDYYACTHQCMMVFEYRDDPPKPYHTKIKDTYEMCDLLEDCKFHTATLVFRADLLKELYTPPNCVSGDKYLYFLCAKYGKIKCFPEPMSVYRINNTGISTRVTPAMMKKDLNLIPWLVELYPNFPKYQYSSYIHKTIISYPPKVPLHTYIKHYFLYAWYSFSLFPKNVKPLLRFTFFTTSKFAVLRLFPNIKWKRLKPYR